MADCARIQRQIVRAQVKIGRLSWGVPGSPHAVNGHLVSLNISKSRGSPVAKMSCTLHTWITTNYERILEVQDSGLGAVIYAFGGRVDDPKTAALPQLFTGYVKDIKVNPHWSDSRIVILDVEAEDVFSKMFNTKYSRRFKMKDAAFAIITGGNRRQGGKMNELRRGQKSSSRFEQKATGSDQFGENSPLIKTPDPLNRTPKGRSPSSRSGKKDQKIYYRFMPQHLIMKPGDRAIVKLMDDEDEQRTVGEGPEFDIDVNSYKPTCLCFMSPKFEGGSGGGSSFKAVDITKPGGSPGSITIIPKYHKEFGELAGAFLVQMKDWYPFKIVYIDPDTKGTATLDVAVVYPHDHRDISRGGPGIGVYDTFQL